MKFLTFLFSLALCSSALPEVAKTNASEKEALLTIKSLGRNLKKELTKAIKESPSHAVKVCNVEANKIAKEASKKGIKVGRVSRKNRNPNNTPKEWMLETITRYHQNKIDEPYVVIDLKDNKKGLLKPIKTQPLCLSCHGEHVAPETEAQINKLYPNDKATGYKLGEIRGFFWAEYIEKSN